MSLRRIALSAARLIAWPILAVAVDELLARTGHHSATCALGAALTLAAIGAVAELTGRPPHRGREAAS